MKVNHKRVKQRIGTKANTAPTTKSSKSQTKAKTLKEPTSTNSSLTETDSLQAPNSSNLGMRDQAVLSNSHNKIIG